MSGPLTANVIFLIGGAHTRYHNLKFIARGDGEDGAIGVPRHRCRFNPQKSNKCSLKVSEQFPEFPEVARNSEEQTKMSPKRPRNSATSFNHYTL